jgi:hypothetical protein
MSGQFEDGRGADQVVSGPAMAAMAAAGIGCTVLGVLTVMVEASERVKALLNLYDPVGPLSGKTIGAVGAYLVAWVVLGSWLRRRDVPVRRWIVVSLAMIGLGLVLTFPPVFQAFGK